MDSSAGDNVLINASSATFGDGIIGADVKTLSGDYKDANLVVRYQDANNFYLVQVYGGQIIIFKRVSGTYYAQASVGISPDFTGGFYRLQATVIGGIFNVWWKGQQVLTWTDPSPWTTGKAGVRQCVGRNIHWDNFSAVTFTAGQVYAYDDFYPFGQQMDGRSMTVGADGRYKYTGKERDAETGWDYYGARYYDPRVGRWLGIDPLAQTNPNLSPFAYCANNPLKFIDADGRNYGVTIDHEKKTVTISATYYVSDDESREAAEQGAAEWNAYTGTYTTGDGEEYAVSFELKVVQVAQSYLAENAMANDPTGNTFEVSQTKFEQAVRSSNSPDGTAGITIKTPSGNRRQVYMPEHGTNGDLFAHEMGHTLFQEHGGDVMSGNFSNLSATRSVSERDANGVARDAMRQARNGSDVGIKISIIGEYPGESFYRSWFTRTFLGNGVSMTKAK